MRPHHTASGDPPVEMDVCVKEKGVADEDVKLYIRKHLKSRIKRDYPLLDFFHRVWKVIPEDIPEGQYPIPGLQHYSNSRSHTEPGKRVEATACNTFQNTLYALAHQFITPAGGVQHEPISFIYDRTIRGHFAKMKPDFGHLLARGDDTYSLGWESFGLVGELKFDHRVAAKVNQDAIVANINISQVKVRFSPNRHVSGLTIVE